MKKTHTGKLKCLAVFVLAPLLLQGPAAALLAAEPLCTHVHSEACLYSEATPCSHAHTEACGPQASTCAHTCGDGLCAYSPAAACVHEHSAACSGAASATPQPEEAPSPAIYPASQSAIQPAIQPGSQSSATQPPGQPSTQPPAAVAGQAPAGAQAGDTASATVDATTSAAATAPAAPISAPTGALPAASTSCAFSVDGVAVTVTENSGVVSSAPATAGYWSNDTGWKYVDSGNYLALSGASVGTLSVTQGQLPLAVAGLNQIATLHTGAAGSSVVLAGSGILLVDKIEGAGSVLLAGDAALFLKDAGGAYVLQASARLDEHYTLPTGKRYVIPNGVTLTLGATELGEPLYEVNTARLVVPAGSEMRVEGGGAVFLECKGFHIYMYAAYLDIQGKLTVYDGGKIDSEKLVDCYGRVMIGRGASLLVQPGGMLTKTTLDLNAAATAVTAHLSGGRVIATPDAAGTLAAAPWRLAFHADDTYLVLDEEARSSGTTTYTLAGTVIQPGARLLVEGHDTTSATMLEMYATGEVSRPAPRLHFSDGISGGGDLTLTLARADTAGDVTLGKLALYGGTLNVNGRLTANEYDTVKGTLNTTEGGASLRLFDEAVAGGGIPLYSALLHQRRNVAHESRQIWHVASSFPPGYTGPKAYAGGLGFAEMATPLPQAINAPFTPIQPPAEEGPTMADYMLDRFEIHGWDSAGRLRSWLVSIDTAFSADVSDVASVLYITAVYTFCDASNAQAGGSESNTISDSTMNGVLGRGEYTVPPGSPFTPINSATGGDEGEGKGEDPGGDPPGGTPPAEQPPASDPGGSPSPGDSPANTGGSQSGWGGSAKGSKGGGSSAGAASSAAGGPAAGAGATAGTAAPSGGAAAPAASASSSSQGGGSQAGSSAATASKSTSPAASAAGNTAGAAGGGSEAGGPGSSAASLAGATTPKRGGMPAWGWGLVTLGGGGLVGAGAFLWLRARRLR